jgi:hypothetical protein
MSLTRRRETNESNGWVSAGLSGGIAGLMQPLQRFRIPLRFITSAGVKRAQEATLAEIMAATNCQAHTVRGFVSILGSKGAEKIESSKSAAGERTYKVEK